LSRNDNKILQQNPTDTITKPVKSGEKEKEYAGNKTDKAKNHDGSISHNDDADNGSGKRI
jgi:hypothetical protein